MATSQDASPAEPAKYSRTARENGGSHPAAGYFAGGSYRINLGGTPNARMPDRGDRAAAPLPSPARTAAVQVVSDGTTDGLEAALRYAMRPDDGPAEPATPPPSPAQMMATNAGAMEPEARAAAAAAPALISKSRARPARASSAARERSAPPVFAAQPARRPDAARRRWTALLIFATSLIAGGLVVVAALPRLKPAAAPALPEPAAAPVSLALAPPPPPPAPLPAEPADAESKPDTTAPPNAETAQSETASGDVPAVPAPETDVAVPGDAAAPEMPAAPEDAGLPPATAVDAGSAPAPAPAIAAPAPAGDLYIVQVAAYRTEKTARRACEAIAQHGFDVETVAGTAAAATAHRSGGGWFYCRSRRSMPHEEAKEMQRRIRAGEHAAPLLLPSSGETAG